ncbi:hypothetical protein LCGC14_1316530 [marine sediment metagenome]|uniref:Right handed beta helix domain-containing protein n=1 Tax=marine sediment metagenome TaxID=412755 RepID=A0A0F9N1L5_9ZZZZ
MARAGPVTGDFTGDRRYLGQVQFAQAVTGMMNVPGTGQIWYVDKNKTSGTTGDGKTWLRAFLTVTEGIAALSNYDVLMIAPGNYDEDNTLSLSGLYGVKILGFANGMNWGEGSTCIRDVTSTDDILDIDGCRSIEISGISFINSGAYDAINIGATTGCYSIHIHHCAFTGDTGGGATGLYGVYMHSGKAPDTYIHDCKFFHYATVGIDMMVNNQRGVVHDCFFIVSNGGIGINVTPMTSSYHGIWRCNFLGAIGDNGDQGIDVGDVSLPGRLMVADCIFAGCVMTGGGTDAEIGCVKNYASSATGGAIEDPT